MKKRKNNEYKSPYSILDENISILRTNIRFAKNNPMDKILAISSPNTKEGKSTVTYELAKSFAQDGQTVLLIDCNLRDPFIDTLGGYDGGRGLVNILINDVNPAEVVVADEKYQTLDIILSGPTPPNPVELLGSKQMQNLLVSVKEHYDYVLLDTSSMCLTSDAGIISSYADGTILVIEKGMTQGADIEKAIRRIEHLGGNFLGFILNDIKGIS